MFLFVVVSSSDDELDSEGEEKAGRVLAIKTSPVNKFRCWFLVSLLPSSSDDPLVSDEDDPVDKFRSWFLVSLLPSSSDDPLVSDEDDDPDPLVLDDDDDPCRCFHALAATFCSRLLFGALFVLQSERCS